jgi:uncharacterized membrane protein YphA (DoxX/SURF4 family)
MYAFSFRGHIIAAHDTERSNGRDRNKKRIIAVWVLRVILGLASLTIGTAKLTGTLHTVETFEAFRWDQWFRYVTGLLDIIGALLELEPRWAFYGALVLACTVGLAAVISCLRLTSDCVRA